MDLRDKILSEAANSNYVSRHPNLLALILNQRPSSRPDTYWNSRFDNIFEELPGWRIPLESLQRSGALDLLASALDTIEILAPLPSKIFRAFAEIPLNSVNVVFLGQDPYSTVDRSRTSLKELNDMHYSEIAQMLGEGYENWNLAQPNQGKLCAIPYAIGKCFAYPSICKEPPTQFQNLKECARLSLGRNPNMDPELKNWSEQGVLMMNSCPILYESSRSNPNIWTAWTCEMLGAIAKNCTYCVFVLMGNSAKSFKSSIISANTNACIIETSHPTARADGDFMNSDLFRRINEFRTSLSIKPIKF